MQRREWTIAIALSVGVAGATLVPYLAAERLAGGEAVFAGFLINPIDAFSYLAKMRQGADGSWLFHLPYAPAPGDGALLFSYYLMLGHLAQALGAPLLTVFHAARLTGSLTMYLAAFWLYTRILPDPRARWSAFGLTLVGSGLGWAAVPMGRMAADLWIPELIPSFSAYASAHFSLAAAAYLVGLLSLLPGSKLVLRVSLAALSGLVLSVLQPFSVLGLLAVAAGWLGWEALQAGRREWKMGGPPPAGSLGPLFALVLGAAPQLAYDAWVFRTEPAFASWAAQNQTPSPPPLDYLLGLGVIGVLALVGIAKGRAHHSAHGRLLIAWTLVQGLLLYAPVGVQRRLALGWFFPLAALAGTGLATWLGSSRKCLIGLALAFALSLPSNLLLVGAGLSAVARGEPALVLSRGELEAYEWLADHTRGSPLVLAAPDTGNRLPAFADVRVLYGHPFETPDAEQQRRLVESLFRSTQSAAKDLQRLGELGVDLVFYGPREQALGRPSWLDGLTVLHRTEGVVVYEVPRP
ncbi:MAG: hypothetical protein AB1449_13420 [Chloroflexota bacterium]